MRTIGREAAVTAATARVRDDHRADYLFSTKAAATAVGCHPNKFGDWWRRTRDKLTELAAAQPAETGAELMAVLAEAAARKEAS